mmetsp:Transcript_22628/g.47476  ORF Transcript_22628/g.47476 Transcript_22628/m.47476 type:complete len:306 (-) Transcript_22628:330-1247(-)|eukprot:CAMPEP_0168193066 /NCGR_PEP_ID=MMETSP0139_2-20121125/18395_1 /TAXON_ID=44445 /ORGANISM="Pseudo-nitzschia australis, Strain 10249 10 AB" /LENGTH=305 /DNA_ID=CAMNT_0008116371 /DNA_START=182 /DNA_END=1099 /DNA_ORIENTATION=-
MAFEQNLEADRIEGFNIFSAFVRVPLLVLGGILGGDGSSSFNNVDSDDSLMSHSLSRSMDVDLNNSATNNNSDVQFHGAATDCTRPLNQQQTLNMTSINHSIQREKPDCRADHTHNNQGMKRTKTMSWSDESGLPLVYENDESVMQHDLNSNPYSSATASLHKPTKSAMRKSRSIRQVTDGLSRQDIITSSASRYIPNMNPRTAGNGLIMPTRPYGGHPSVENKAHGSNSAEMSPQWGWYINTTPPTPELYHKRPSSYSSTFNKQQLVKGDSSTIDSKSCQNRVFQDLQNSKKTNPMGGWTSIPI